MAHLVSAPAPAAAGRREPSIAVLPFANLSADKENEYFGDGLADEIITELSRLQGLRVTARTSSFLFRDRPRDVREIGARLGVSSVLEGSIQRRGARVRVSAQLVNTDDGFHRWSERYDREIADVFEIQDDISRSISNALKLRLSGSRAAKPVVNLQAYNLWLRARHYQHHEDLNALAKSRVCLEQAIAIDPSFPQAYLALADVLRHAALWAVIRPRDALVEGWAAIQKAADLDDSLAEVHALSGAYRAWRDYDWDAARRDFDRALEMAPGSEQAHRLFANYYCVPVGKLREAEMEMQRAVESDPLSPLAHIELGKVLLWSRDFDRAEAEFEMAFDLRPDYGPAVWFRGVALFFRGRLEEALAFWPPEAQRYSLGPTGLCLALLGRHDEARALLSEIDIEEQRRYISPMARAQIHAGLGETAAALEWLDRTIDERDPHILDLPSKPIWDGIRNHPGFRSLLRKMRLA